MTELLTALTLVFASASVMLFLLDRFSHAAIPAYIIAGIAIGGFIDGSQILGLSQLGIAFLVFLFGIKTEPENIRSVATESLSTTVVQVAVVGIAAYIVGRGLGLDQLNAFYLTIAAALSSSIVGLQLIEDEIRIDLLHGRLAESINLIQDILAIMAILVVSSPVLELGIVATNMAYGMAMIVAALVIRRTVFPFVAEQAKASEEMTMLTGLSLLLVFIGFAEFLDISIVVGSFAAGLAAAKFPHNLEMLETFSSLKDFFSAIFFVSLGALLSYPKFETMVLAAVLIAATAAVKPAVTVISLLVNGYDRRTSYLAGLTLDQVSEFALIIAIQAFIAGTIRPEVFNAIILSATFTMISSAYVSRHEEKIYDLISSYSRVETNDRQIAERTSVPEDLVEHVILVGYDTQGKRMAQGLKDENADFLIVENNPERITEARQNHDNYVFGDVMDSKTWRRANYQEAALIISTIPQKKISEKILGLDTEADIVLRSEDTGDAADLLESGALYVEVPDIVASEQLIDHLSAVLQDTNYREELRRRNLLEVRKYLEQEEG
ncbi:MAG: cation:proton antiporter [Candidatus Nanohaloarchaea archaeon]